MAVCVSVCFVFLSGGSGWFYVLKGWYFWVHSQLESEERIEDKVGSHSGLHPKLTLLNIGVT